MRSSKSSYLLVFSIMFLLVCSFVAAETNISENSEFTISEVANKITPNQKAEYKITFTNNKEITQRYSIHSFVKGWDVAPSPVKDKIVQLNPGKTYSVTMLAKTLEDFPSGLYYLPITVQTDQGEEYSDQLKVYLSPQEEASYAPALSIDIDMDDKIAARSAIPIKLFIENRNPLNLSGVTIRIQSDIPEFVQEAIVDLPPLEKKTVEFPVAVAEFQQPKEYTLFFVLEKDGQTLKVVEKKIEIIPSLPPFTVTQEADPKYLKEFHAVTAENTGNVKNSQVIRVHLPWWGSFLTTSETGKVVTDNGEKYVQWELELSPSESTSVYYITNYRILLYILIVLLLFGAFYWYASSPLAVRKSAITVKSDDGGALSEIKITLEVRNKTTKSIKNVKITDIVPAIANVTKSLELGTLRPETIKHAKEGTKVIWSLAELDVHEHRLITYTIKASLNILGTFSLPRAVVEYGTKKKKRKAYSNIFSIGT